MFRRGAWLTSIEETLVTCGQMNKVDLKGDTVDFASELSASNSPDSHRICVKYGDAVFWTLPVSECQTWFVSACVERLPSN